MTVEVLARPVRAQVGRETAVTAANKASGRTALDPGEGMVPEVHTARRAELRERADLDFLRC